MWSYARDEIWEAMARWSAGLPPGVRLLVNGCLARGLAARFTVERAWTYAPPMKSGALS